MINVLVVDDNQHKIRAVRRLLEIIPEVKIFETATNVTSAKQYLVNNHYDLLILDLSLPTRDGDDPFPQNGVNFLNEINRNPRFKKPFHIIGFSEFDDFIETFKGDFSDELWALVKYDQENTKWEKQILNRINYLINSKRDLKVADITYNYDLAILTALRSPELDAVLKLDGNWDSFRLSHDSTEYFRGIFTKGNLSISVIAACAPQMGMVATSVLTNKVIENFRPKYVAMVGIAGGIKGVGNLGDVLIADQSFDSGSGKIKTTDTGERLFEPDFKSIDLDTDVRELFLSCKGSRAYVDRIKNDWPVKDIPTELNIHIGPFASGAGVIANNQVIEEIKGHSRKLIGLDMESYGLFYTSKHCSKPRPISAFSMKSVSDFGDKNKDDRFQAYCSFTSANFLYHFVLNHLFVIE
ncbi:phosphorylase family protein [Dyadobacter tibetensis]|uniref:phosphorylase family protein n=1 Tax=Dyadobacter tibetensis TaxID=1211851 RepID=UPI00046F24D3|nr:response regulator [Dyadobacter tibetensis]